MQLLHGIFLPTLDSFSPIRARLKEIIIYIFCVHLIDLREIITTIHSEWIIRVVDVTKSVTSHYLCHASPNRNSRLQFITENNDFTYKPSKSSG